MATVANTLRVAVVGCGKVADQHVGAINRVPQARIVSACDREILMAKQLAERSGIENCFSDVGEMLQHSKPDVVHITTPPQSHFPIAKQCLHAGSHVYLEKPFTVTGCEAQALIELAELKGLKITVGHNYQFTLEMIELRRSVKEGFLGGPPIHLESYWSYDLGDISYVGPVLGNSAHWVRQLPGQLLHNIISHGLAKLAEFVSDEPTELFATAFQSPQLQNSAARGVLDELRVAIRSSDGTTAFFCFSTQIRGTNQLRVYGPAGSLTADIITGSTVKRQSRAYKSYLTYFVPPLNNAREHLRNERVNISNFIRQRLHQDFGMKELIERFYRSIQSDSAVPIPYREILWVARVMDTIFAQIGVAGVKANPTVSVGTIPTAGCLPVA